jgi:hypothetical protein
MSECICIIEYAYIFSSDTISGGIHTLSSRGNSEKRHDSQEKLTDHQSQMASSRGTGSEDNDSDFDNQSHEDDIDNDDDQSTTRRQTEDLINEQEEQKKQLIVLNKLLSNFHSLFFQFSYVNKKFFGVSNKNGYEKKKVILNN